MIMTASTATASTLALKLTPQYPIITRVTLTPVPHPHEVCFVFEFGSGNPFNVGDDIEVSPLSVYPLWRGFGMIGVGVPVRHRTICVDRRYPLVLGAFADGHELLGLTEHRGSTIIESLTVYED
jgi:hypothetical protein